MSIGVQLADALGSACQGAIQRSLGALTSIQDPKGYWWGDLTADTTLESDFILLQVWMYPPEGGKWNPPNREIIDRAVASILARQLEDGGFNIYQQGPSEISASIKAYFALKICGLGVDDSRMARLRERILALGGMQAANSYVKVNLSLFGLFPREYTPSIPPEIILFGNFIYEMSSWTRAIVIPLSIVHSANPQARVPDGFTLDELFVPGAGLHLPSDGKFLSWRHFFLTVDRALKWWETSGLKALRRKAVKRCEEWMLERTHHSDGLGAIYPPMMYAIMAYDVLGYAKDHPARAEAVRQFERLMVNDERGFFFQPCFSPVWDTGILAFAMGETGQAPAPAMRDAANWLLSKEVRKKGDWSVKRPGVEPSGWYFEFANEFYPDIDDTAMVLLALKHAWSEDREKQRSVIDRAVKWLLAMQSKDGGWAAFDVDNNWHMLSEVPFADHNAMLDPTCPDITGRVMEALVTHGVSKDHPAIKRGVEYLIKTQEADGSWFGRWGVNYVYGTFLALRGLRAAGVDEREACILRAGEWLRSIQNADGGWGESCEGYDRGTFVPAPSTASQTAWGVLGLLAGGDSTSMSVRKGVERLIDTQRADGRWHEDLATGTGFPRVFYLTYHLYRDSFPLMALAAYKKTLRGDGKEAR
jgi:squalene-hopene/tetraprenyl-beta-curcumene cyclase